MAAMFIQNRVSGRIRIVFILTLIYCSSNFFVSQISPADACIYITYYSQPITMNNNEHEMNNILIKIHAYHVSRWRSSSTPVVLQQLLVSYIEEGAGVCRRAAQRKRWRCR